VSSGEGAVVVGVDGSEESERALWWAAATAKLHGASLHVVHCFAPLAAFEGAGLPVLHNAFLEFERAGRELLDDAVRKVFGEVTVTSDMPCEGPAPALLSLSDHARTIVVGATGSGGFVGMLAGSTTTAVAAHARCPVVVVRGGGDGEGPVVVGVDGSPASGRAVAAGFDEANRRGAALVAVHALGDLEQTGLMPRRPHVMPAAGRAVLAEGLAGWPEKYPDVPVSRITVADRSKPALLDWSRRARLVVVGRRGRGGFAGLPLGSTGRALVHHADCPVMVVPAAPRSGVNPGAVAG
jgi:nucleotide-binding universal stress UspA family protein